MNIEYRNAVSPASIWVEPDDCGKTVLEAVTNARQSVDIVIYEIGGPKILAALKSAKKNGADIRIMVNGQFFKGPDPDNGRYDQTYAMMTEPGAAAGDGRVDFQ